MGTHNRLAFLADTYIELIGVFDAGRSSSPRPHSRSDALRSAPREDGRGSRPTPLPATTPGRGHRLRPAGSPIGEPGPGASAAGRRDRPLGHRVPLARAREPPFLIEHETAGAEWGPEARSERDAFRHPGGGRVRLARLTVPVRSPEVAAARWSAVLALRFTANTGDRLTVMTSVGSQEIVLVPRAAGVLSTVDLSADTGSSPVDMEHIGLRWRRRGRPPAPR